MKKQFILISALVGGFIAYASQQMLINKDGIITYTKSISTVDSLKLANGQLSTHDGSSVKVIDFSNIDSMTFQNIDDVVADSTIRITYYTNNTVALINPYYASGVTITVDGVDQTESTQTIAGSKVVVTATSEIADLNYYVEGTTNDGYLEMTTAKKFNLRLNGANITSSTTAAINIVSTKAVDVFLTGDNTLADGASSDLNGAFNSNAELTFKKSSTGTLKITGNAKHALRSKSYIEVNGGTVEIANAASDAIHCDEFEMKGGSVIVDECTNDCIDASKPVSITGGSLKLASTSDDMKGINAGSTVSIKGGTIDMELAGKAAKGIKTDEYEVLVDSAANLNIDLTGTSYYIVAGSDTSFSAGIKSDGAVTLAGGTTTISNSGAAGKGIKANGNVSLTGGTNTINTTGENVVLSYDNNVSNAITTDGQINITGGTNIITVGSAALGAKGLTADGDININGGTTTVNDDALFAGYTATSGQDTTFVSCIKSDANINILSGTLTCATTNNGKGINASGDNSVLTIGQLGATGPTVNVTTTPNSSYSYTSANSDNVQRTHYTGNPRGLSCGDGDIVINSGTTVVSACANAVHGYNVAVNGGTIDVTAAGSSTASSSSNGMLYAGGFSGGQQGGGQQGGGSSSSLGITFKGLHADSLLAFTGGSTIVRNAYEGFEGAIIRATGGTTEINCTDDAWNASTSHLATSSSSSAPGQGGQQWGQQGNTNSSSGTTAELTISGGQHFFYCQGDGLDSNGTLTVSGGVVVITGQGNGDAPIDSEDSSISGNAVIMICGSWGMSEQYSCSVNSTTGGTASAGNVVTVTANNSVVFALNAQAAGSVTFMNPTYSSVSISTSGSVSSYNYFPNLYNGNIVYIDSSLIK